MRARKDPANPADSESAQCRAHAEGRVRQALAGRPIVLVGLMGAGKSTVGRRLAARLGMVFRDADNEIEAAAGMSIPDIFAVYGEAHFRDGERRVIERLLHEERMVLATGGGAYMDETTRARIRAHAVSVWLRADLDTLMRRVRKRSNRPLLQNADPEGVMRRLMDARYPVYAEADVVVESREGPHEKVVEAIIAALDAHLAGSGADHGDEGHRSGDGQDDGHDDG
ncbi:MAG: shikimate kinase AroK [Saliniramus fredricksonii]|uniref:Shikimate kinase n=1 Tax=Saliniramus fredricksonii TaxID=1653334 RepID=A0A0P7XA97_9HYPH|nr:MAG: shikimate kinase AroK [Saliniramus fredricksonii]SCC78798.1 shikimate kinase [Saliniramus fredricksonii]